LQAGESVVVYGAGGVGLSVVQGARLANAGRIIVVDLDDEKLRLAQTMGATDLVNPMHSRVKDVVQDLTLGRGVEYVFEAVGRPDLMQQGIDLLARGGALVLIGATDRDASLAFAPRRFMSMQQRIIGCIFGNIRPEIDFPLFADWYMDGRLHLDEMHTATVDLVDVPALFANPARRHGIRTVVQLETTAI
jgi:S-(hydroxymethyl)glutathione dehydrogenase/alcohol dehydrogenase